MALLPIPHVRAQLQLLLTGSFLGGVQHLLESYGMETSWLCHLQVGISVGTVELMLRWGIQLFN